MITKNAILITESRIFITERGATPSLLLQRKEH
nr:MAG TPA: hypothetical protein [Caudoviricetes sp.]